jgi:hypothetical protein
MNCNRCEKRITEVTAQLYGGRCMPCHRKRMSQRLRATISISASVLAGILATPLYLAREIRLRLTQVPFNRREVINAIVPICGQESAKEYFRGLRLGFQRGGGPFMSYPPIRADGLNDGWQMRLAPPRWRTILQNRVTSLHFCRSRGFDASPIASPNANSTDA